MPIKTSHRESAFSLVEILLGLALFAMLLLLIQKQIGLNMNFNKRTGDRYDLLQISHDLQKSVNCKRAPLSCPLGTRITLFSKSVPEKILIDRRGITRVRNWSLVAECGTQDRFLIRVAMQNDKGDFLPDPLSKHLLDFEHPQSVLMPEGTLCPAGMDSSRDGNVDVQIQAGLSCVVPRKALLPCNPPQPPACSAGFSTSGMTLDNFGGETDPRAVPLFGQRWVRYCFRKN